MDFSNAYVDRIIHKNRAEYNRLLKRALACKDADERIDRLWDASFQAAKKTCGFYSAPELENALADTALLLKGPVRESFEPNSFLHVFTETYLGGGHTQVAMRWIEASPTGQKHSVFISTQSDESEIPARLKEAVSVRGGTFTVLDPRAKAAERALKLREHASGFETVILHVHPEDVLPVLAFASPDFKRPVVLFNHADHLYWTGGTVADLVVNFRTFASGFNETYRKITRNTVLPLPVNEPSLSSPWRRLAVRKELGIPADGKIMLSVASSYKYTPFDGLDFARTARRVLDRVPDSYLVVVGPAADEPYWSEAAQASGGRIKVLGMLPFTKLEPYFQASDLILDSFPFNSFTAFFDGAKYNIPTLSLQTPLGHTDTHEESGVSCATQEELAERAVNLLQNPPEGDTRVYELLRDNQFPQGFKRRLEALYNSFPAEHRMYPPQPDGPRAVTEFERFVEKNLQAKPVSAKEKRKRFKRALFWCKWGKRERLIRLLGITLYSRKFH